MKKFSLLLLFTLSSALLTLEAQDRLVIDSLQTQLKQFEATKNELGKNATPLMDTVKEEILYQIAIAYWGTVPDTAIYYAQMVLTLSKQIGYEKGVGNYYNAMGLAYMAMKNYPGALNNYKNALKVRTEIGDKTGMAWTYNDMGLMYGNMGEIEESIKWHTQSLQIKKEINDTQGTAASYGKIGNDYISIGKFPEALNNYLNELKIWEEVNNTYEIGGVYNDIGNLYYKVGNYPEALKNYRNALQIANKIGDMEQIAFADINLGRICYKQGNDTAAINYLKTSLKILKELHVSISVANIHYYLGLVYLDMGNFPLAFNNADSSLKEWQIFGARTELPKVYIEIGSIYEKQGKFQDALESVAKGLSLAKKTGTKVEIKDAYGRLADIDASMHNFEAAYRDNNEYIKALDSLSSNESANKIATLEMNYAFEKREDSTRAAQEKRDIIKADESHQKSLITAGAVVISLLTLVLAFVFVSRQQLKRKKDKMLFEKNIELSEKEKGLLKLEKQQMENELANAKVGLDEYIKNLVEKNELLEQFKLDVENLTSQKDAQLVELRIKNLEHLNKTTILTDEDWNKFKILFEQVHIDFMKRLKEKMQNLTQAEIRLLCLTKLDLGTKQMAGILGVSITTIRQSRYRLRKKFGLSEEGSLNEIVESI